MMMDGWGMGFGGVGFLGMAIFWIAILVAAIWLLGNLFPRSNTSQSPRNEPESPVEIVKRRYARGEISHEEYEATLHNLEQSGPMRSAQ